MLCGLFRDAPTAGGNCLLIGRPGAWSGLGRQWIMTSTRFRLRNGRQAGGIITLAPPAMMKSIRRADPAQI